CGDQYSHNHTGLKQLHHLLTFFKVASTYYMGKKKRIVTQKEPVIIPDSFIILSFYALGPSMAQNFVHSWNTIFTIVFLRRFGNGVYTGFNEA
ncbi:hypothetical protein, partial [Heliobacterium chlorum]|uniref:hypothetical protein n=1 Tax=Heliobacterium chlorum TaxID=2698 RepID=UPI001A9C143B